MPRITKSGPVRFMATELYLITSTVATGVGGGFLFPDASPCHHPRHRGSAVLKNGKVVPTASLRRCYHPAAIFQQSRAEVGPNSYARGDHIRPCYIGQRSAKREPCIIGKRTVSPGRFFRMDCRSRPWVYRITERIFPTSRDCRFVELVFPLCVKDVDRSTP